MGMYYCHECGDLRNDDSCPAHEHPSNDAELCCPSCYSELQELAEEERNGEDFRKPRIAFDKNQRIAIAQMEKEGPHEY